MDSDSDKCLLSLVVVLAHHLTLSVVVVEQFVVREIRLNTIVTNSGDASSVRVVLRSTSPVGPVSRNVGQYLYRV